MLFIIFTGKCTGSSCAFCVRYVSFCWWLAILIIVNNCHCIDIKVDLEGILSSHYYRSYILSGIIPVCLCCCIFCCCYTNNLGQSFDVVVVMKFTLSLSLLDGTFKNLKSTKITFCVCILEFFPYIQNFFHKFKKIFTHSCEPCECISDTCPC